MSPGEPPLAGRTGRGVRVAVIDSGVNPSHPHIGRVERGVAFQPDGTIAEGLDAALDRFGHGTAVMAAIQDLAPDAAYIAVRVFRDELRTSAATLLRAIDWCAEEGVDIINLSLGTTNEAHRDMLGEAADRARAAGCLIVAAVEAGGRPCFPGCLPGVLGVDVDYGLGRDRYRFAASGHRPIFLASGHPRSAPGVPVGRNLHGISFAVANMSGFAARACETAGPDRSPGRLDAVHVLLVAGASGRADA